MNKSNLYKNNIGVVMFDAAYPPPILGGKEKQAHLLSRTLLESSLANVVVLTRVHSGQKKGSADYESVPIKRIAPDRFEVFRYIYQLIKLRRGNQVLHVHTPSRIGCVIAIIGCFLKYKVVFKFPNEGLLDTQNCSVIQQFLIRLVIKLSDSLIVLEKNTKLALKSIGIPNDRVNLMSNGVEIQNTEKISCDTKKIKFLHVARLCPQKRTKDLLYALSKINEKESWSLTILGDGPLMDMLMKLSIELNIDANVNFLGQVADVKSYIRKSDCLVICSEKEGMPNVVLEAMASQLAVIGTKVGNIPEMLSEQKEMLIEPANVEMLEKKLQWCIESPEELSVKGDALQKVAISRYSIQTVAKDYTKLYSGFFCK